LISGKAAEEFLKMKKNLALVLGVLLIFGFVLLGCSSEDKGTAPKVVVTTWEVASTASGSSLTIAKTTFKVNETVGIRFTFTDPDKDVKGYGFSIKRADGSLYISRREYDFNQINNGNTSDTFNYWATNTSFNTAGTYTIEAYGYDMKGNKTTATATLTVQ